MGLPHGWRVLEPSLSEVCALLQLFSRVHRRLPLRVSYDLALVCAFVCAFVSAFACVLSWVEICFIICHLRNFHVL